MTDQVVKTLTDPSFLIALLVAIAVFATVFTVLPSLSGNPLKGRMKAVALERDELRAKQRMRLAAEADRRHKGLREQQSIGMRNIVERLDLRRALVDEATVVASAIAAASCSVRPSAHATARTPGGCGTSSGRCRVQCTPCRC